MSEETMPTEAEVMEYWTEHYERPTPNADPDANCFEVPGMPHLGFTQRERSAFHEAGHAVVATLQPNARNPELASIMLSPGRTTMLPAERDVSTMPPQELRDEAMAYAAGAIAEALATGEANPSPSDNAQIDVLCRLHTTPARKLLTEIRQETRKLVFNYWPAVREVALFMLRDGGANGATVREVIRQTPTMTDRARALELRDLAKAMRETLSDCPETSA